MKYMWDRAIVINRPDREDRRDQFFAGAKNSKLLGDVQLFAAVTPKTFAYPSWFQGHIGSKGRQAAYWCCRESHLRVWSQAILDGVEHLLVFEDDAGIPESFDQQVQAFFEELPSDWLGYQLGGWAWKGAERVSANCGRMRGCGALHAYGLSKAGIQRIYDHVLWHNTPDLDHATAQLHGEEPHFYCPRDWFVPQRGSYSDNYLNWAGGGGTGRLW